MVEGSISISFYLLFVPPAAALQDDAFDHDAALQACARGDLEALRSIYEREPAIC
jgi:RNA polymerase sigma-70 factor (ECF subfamily)